MKKIKINVIILINLLALSNAFAQTDSADVGRYLNYGIPSFPEPNRIDKISKVELPTEQIGSYCGLNGYAKGVTNTAVISCQGHNPALSCPTNYRQVAYQTIRLNTQMQTQSVQGTTSYTCLKYQ